MKPFDKYIGIDWSGACSVQSQAISVASVDHISNVVELVHPLRQKSWSRRLIYEYICDLSRANQRIFIGIDANFSYAYDVALGKIENIRNVSDLWRLVDAYCSDNPNFYAASFWKHPGFQSHFWENGKKPLHLDLIKRETEIECGIQKLGYPESPFKLLGPKQVGKGGLAAMRMMHALRQELREKVAFWPFDTRGDINQARIVMSEIYPRLFIKKAGLGGRR